MAVLVWFALHHALHLGIAHARSQAEGLSLLRCFGAWTRRHAGFCDAATTGHVAYRLTVPLVAALAALAFFHLLAVAKSASRRKASAAKAGLRESEDGA